MDITLLTPRGRLDAAGTRPFEAEMKQHIAGGRVRLLVDLSETTYISSNGLRVLLAALKETQTRGGALVLCCLKPRLAEIFEMSGFDRVFEIFSTRVAAEKSFDA
ncbi:MAG: STAS domain-containing protein [Chloroflexi bacterium]|nr:STAS domain-containing protein [Chloroflexota bacterium]